MVTRTWIGFDNENASDPSAWSPAGSPRPGDTLLLPPDSTISIAGKALRGDTLTIPNGHETSPNPPMPHVVLNLSNNAELTLQGQDPTVSAAIINVSGNATVAYTGTAGHIGHYAFAMPVTVNLDDGAHMTGSFAMDSASLTVNAGSDSQFIDNGTSNLLSCQAVISPDLVGTGTMNVMSAGTRGSSLELAGGVGQGQVIDVEGIISGYMHIKLTSSVKVDHPDFFAGTIDLKSLSSADFVGLDGADHWSYARDLLSLFDVSGAVIDRIHLVSADPSAPQGVHGLSVTASAAGDLILAPGSSFAGIVVKPGV